MVLKLGITYMYKKLIGVVMLFYCIAMQAMDQPIELAQIESNIIKLSTHYHLVQGKRISVLDHNAEPVEVVTKPQAFFYGYNCEEKKRNFLRSVEVDVLDKPTIECLNQRIDPNVKLPTITKASISHCLERGIVVRFYDQEDNEIDHTYHYSGSADIKSEEDNIELIKPHALLQQLKEVKESVPLPWYLAICGLTMEENSGYK